MTLFPEQNYPIFYPEGYDEQALLSYLSAFEINGEHHQEMVEYLKSDFKRFVLTLNLLMRVNDGENKKLLEIGSHPFFMSILVKKFTCFNFQSTNYFGFENSETETQFHRHKETGEEIEFQYVNHSIDHSPLPLKEQVDVVLFCEVLEHLINDPLHALLRIKEVLKTGGDLILTTPNVARLENIAKMLAGANIYDPYSGYGIYGRHNREYNKHELYLLLSQLGFEIVEMFTSDVNPPHATSYFDLNILRDHIEFRKNDLGQYIFLRAKNAHKADLSRPDWLFRSYPSGVVVAT
ncbi:hypothetical protein GCM10011332_28010 [Terasakiella brassicae]|uniref:Methyltransferase type 11 domain-containing protein n=1 Tax=Terasakiella brassicae TaxID=1634917 RepID=A0A917C5Y2_9PROT|nr:class I SAM-dependent methyltransferase [Terasakiella brassicae]GGF72440.1 hypothetical protein GCM10011332_28010 [Terasakiella brassicae]